jgi:hypothetical protein
MIGADGEYVLLTERRRAQSLQGQAPGYATPRASRWTETIPVRFPAVNVTCSSTLTPDRSCLGGRRLHSYDQLS